MERIVAQEIPAVVVDNPAVDWNPFTNAVTRSSVNDAPAGAATQAAVRCLAGPVDGAREPDLRYARWLANFHAMQVVDKYSPSQPTHIVRVFETGRQLSEARVQAMLEQVLGSPQVKQVAQLIQKRLGRKLEPFDIWYDGFQAQRRAGRGPARCAGGEALSRRRGLSARDPQHAARAGLCARSRGLCGAAHRRGSGARLRPRHGRGDAAASRRTCARASSAAA